MSNNEDWLDKVLEDVYQMGKTDAVLSVDDWNSLKSGVRLHVRDNIGDELAQAKLEARKANKLADAYARVIQAVYDGERIEDCEPRIMNEIDVELNKER